MNDGVAGRNLTPLTFTSFCVQSSTPAWLKILIWTCSALVKSLSDTFWLAQFRKPLFDIHLRSRSLASWSEFERTSSLNWPRSWRSVSTPTSAANDARITQVSIADPPARRHVIGIRLYAEDVARAADRV